MQLPSNHEPCISFFGTHAHIMVYDALCRLLAVSDCNIMESVLGIILLLDLSIPFMIFKYLLMPMFL